MEDKKKCGELYAERGIRSVSVPFSAFSALSSTPQGCDSAVRPGVTPSQYNTDVADGPGPPKQAENPRKTALVE